jgi:hypothetical protein
VGGVRWFRNLHCIPLDAVVSLAQVAHYAQGFGMNVIAFDDPVPEADLKAVGIEKARLCPNSMRLEGALLFSCPRALAHPALHPWHTHAQT